MAHPDALRATEAPGCGIDQAFKRVISSAFARLVISESRTLSRALVLYHENEKKAIVASIARIVMTMMSSMRVKADR